MTSAIGSDALDTVQAAASGDQAAFTRIVTAHHGDMARVAYLVSGDLEVAAEAVQAAWAIAWRRLGSLRDADRLRPWLVSIAANEARQAMRRRRRRTVLEVPVGEVGERAGSEPDSRPSRDHLLDLQAALRVLDPEDRAIVAMRYALGMTSAEIGREIGLSETGVRSRISRALARLRKELGDG
jgi:RNA polymerase sigma factor (sigma-70 family)